jgi:hypothetical protein
MRSVRILIAFTAVLLASVGFAPSANAWAPAETAAIHPGVQVVSDAGQCTANFIYQGGGSTYIGVAAHCFGQGEITDTDGCDTDSLPLGSTATIDGASQPGTLAYSSWLTMQQVGESDPDACAYNDLALVRINDADVADVNPSVPFFGGPTAIGEVEIGDNVFSYGNSSLRFGLEQLSPKRGVCIDKYASDWAYDVYTVTPGIPGDSGSGFLGPNGQAFGTLSTVQIAPLAGSNGVGSLTKELAYANSHGFSVSLVPGTEPFDSSRLI